MRIKNRQLELLKKRNLREIRGFPHQHHLIILHYHHPQPVGSWKLGLPRADGMDALLRVRPRAIESRPMRPRTSRDHGDFSRALAEIPPNTSSSPTIRISICIIIRYIMESYGINMESLDLGIWNRHPMGDWAYRPKWQGWTMTPCCLCISMEIMDAWSTGIYQGRIQKSSLLFFIR